MTGRLRLFGDWDAAEEQVEKSMSVNALCIMTMGRQHYIKMQSPRPGVEPSFLCTDGAWRKYDNIEDLPFSSARQT